jgi:hypothetical protein
VLSKKQFISQSNSVGWKKDTSDVEHNEFLAWKQWKEWQEYQEFKEFQLAKQKEKQEFDNWRKFKQQMNRGNF